MQISGPRATVSASWRDAPPQFESPTRFLSRSVPTSRVNEEQASGTGEEHVSDGSGVAEAEEEDEDIDVQPSPTSRPQGCISPRG